MSLLEAKKLSGFYSGSIALSEVDFLVNEGSVIALMGRNGMGKTTLIHCVCGIISEKSGLIKFNSVNIHDLIDFQIAKLGIGLVPEGRRIFSNLTVHENLLVSAKEGEWDQKKIYDLFPRLLDRKYQLGGSLSGGEQQMLSIGRALMTNPKLLILDEATEGLSPLIQKEIWNVLTTLKKSGLSIIIVDKSLEKLSTLADHFYFLVKGKIAWNGKYNQLNDKLIKSYLLI